MVIAIIILNVIISEYTTILLIAITVKLITVIKQCLRPYSYKLESKEKYIDGKKHIVYFLENYNPPPKKKENTCLISFD